MARTTCTRSTLRARPLFSTFSDAQLESMMPWIQIRSYSARAPILRTGDVPQGLYLVASGRVKGLLENGHGREVIVEILGADQFFGEGCLFDERAAMQTYVAQQSSEILYVPRKQVLECVHRNAAAALFIASLLAGRLEAAHLKIGSLGLDDVYSRVVDLLLASAREEHGVWYVDMGSELIAAMVGASREMVSRVVKDLVDRHIVRRQRRKIVVMDRDMLRECALHRREPGQHRGALEGAQRSAFGSVREVSTSQ